MFSHLHHPSKSCHGVQEHRRTEDFPRRQVHPNHVPPREEERGHSPAQLVDRERPRAHAVVGRQGSTVIVGGVTRGSAGADTLLYFSYSGYDISLMTVPWHMQV